MQMVWLEVVLLTAAYRDIRERKIPNWLIIIGLLGICIFRYAERGVHGILDGIISGGLVIILFFPLFLIRALGAGDIKLFSMVAFMHGSYQAFVVCTVWLLSAGIFCLYRLLKNGRLYRRIIYAWDYFAKGRVFREPYYQMGRDDPVDTVPLAPFLAAAYGIVMAGRWLRVW